MKKICGILILSLLLSGCAPFETPVSETRFLMDTVCTVKTDSDIAIDAAFSAIAEVENATDFFDENSTVSAFNNAGANTPVPLDIHTETIIKTALHIGAASGGAFDITVAPAKELWDFKSENPAPPNKEQIKEVLPLVDYRNLILNTETHTLAKTKDGIKIDLGGSAKGYAADVAAKAMQDAGAKWGILDLGGNIFVFGKNPGSKDGSYKIGIQKPFDTTGAFDRTIDIENSGAVVTSGIYQRCFEYKGEFYHHILDPKTGMSADTDADGVTILSESGLLADCLSTACLVLDKEKASALAEDFGAEIYFSYSDAETNE